jgi:hypothetical protein
MLKVLSALVLFLTLAPSAQAQVRVELLLDQKQYLLKEPLPVGVRIINHAGQVLSISGTNWLSFTIEDREKFVVKRSTELVPPQAVTIESTYMGTQWIDIGQAFDFRENNNYTLRARVRIEQWGEDVYSDPVVFEIIKGTKLWDQEFGVPAPSGAPPEIRKYILQQANYLKELQLYARVTDASERMVYRVIRLAPMVQVSQPEAQIDTLNRLHVLTQVGLRQFLHVVLDHNGDVTLRNTYEAPSHRLQLRVSDSGGVFVAGGIRLLRKDDVPPSALLSQTNATPPLGLQAEPTPTEPTAEKPTEKKAE